MPTDSQTKYINCMVDVRKRLNLVLSFLQGAITTGCKDADVEFVYLNLRKVLEVIAFSSLVANKQKYSEAHNNFAEHWKAEKMLAVIEKFNPDFYPVPIDPPTMLPNGTKHCERVDGFLTREEFGALYDYSCEFLHTRNPFSSKPVLIRMPYSTKEWVERIQRLLALHVIRLVDGGLWITLIPPEGPLTMYTAELVPMNAGPLPT